MKETLRKPGGTNQIVFFPDDSFLLCVYDLRTGRNVVFIFQDDLLGYLIYENVKKTKKFRRIYLFFSCFF